MHFQPQLTVDKTKNQRFLVQGFLLRKDDQKLSHLSSNWRKRHFLNYGGNNGTG
jgi:hypothetical protein